MPSHNFMLNGTLLETTTEYTYLGVKFTNKRSKDLDALLDTCSWDDIGNFLQTCIKNSLLQTKSTEIWFSSYTVVPHYACINFRSYSTP